MFHRRRMVAPINSIKHYVARTNTGVASGAISTEVLVDAVSVASVGASPDEVEEGSTVKAVWLEYWSLATGVTDSNTQVTAILEKVPAGQASVTFAQLVNLGSYPNKKNVLNTFQGNQGAQINGNGSISLMRGWYKIPKGKQRFGLGDKLVFTYTTSGSAAALCGMAIYKEYK